jgi:SpoVK/Ycf46/Vps4 family AAA+-type ATPase
MGNNISYLKNKETEKLKKKKEKYLIKETNRLFQYALIQDSKKNYLEAFIAYREGVENIYYLISESKKEEFKVALWKNSVDYVQRAILLDLYFNNRSNTIPKATKLIEHVNEDSIESVTEEVIIDDFAYEGFVTKEDKEILSGLRKCEQSCTNLSWDDVVGLEDVKKCLKKQFVWPILYPELISSEKSCQGMLLYGQPGTGKTLVAQCAASEIPNVTFFNFGTSELKSKWHGSSERATAMMFEMARQRKPSIIFIGKKSIIFTFINPFFTQFILIFEFYNFASEVYKGFVFYFTQKIG